MIFDSLDTVLKQKSLPQVLLLFGKEHFLRDEAIEKILNLGKSDNTNSFDIEKTDADNCTQEQIVAMASALPFMSEKRYIIVRNIEKYAVSKAKKKTEPKFPLLKYLEYPSETTFLLLIADSNDLDGLYSQLNNTRTKEKAEKRLSSLKEPFHFLLNNHMCVEFSPLHEREIPSWLTKRMKNEGRDITPEAIDILTTKIGTSLRDLHNEIQKIVIFSPEKKKVTAEDVLNVVGQSRTHNIFELQKAVGEKNSSKALDIMLRMVRTEKNEILIITMLTRYFTVLYKLIEAVTETNNTFELSRAVDINSYFIPEYLSALKHYTPAHIAKAFIALQEADIILKSSSLKSEVIMQKMILTIIGNR